jgi:hypothetical protein
MTNIERRYNTHDQEALAIMEGFKKWRHYLKGVKHEVIIQTDHKNLIYFIIIKELKGQQVR